MAQVVIPQGIQGIDFSALLAGQPHHQQQHFQQPLAVTKNAEKAKKKAPTADQKREKAVLEVLNGRDTFGLNYTALLQQMDVPELEKFVAYVRAKHGMVGQ